jgi:hypothetical protein
MNKIIHGDYQTPADLALEVAAFVQTRIGFVPERVVEPTCGEGAFVRAAAESFPSAVVLGFELDRAKLEGVHVAGALPTQVTVAQGNFFDVDWASSLSGDSCLVLGNPPWVAASRLGEYGSNNRPEVRLELGHTGIENKTGASNFDIAEYMALRLSAELAQKKHGALAFLVKASTARRLATHLQRTRITDVEFYRIDGRRHFGVSVSCGLVLVDFSVAGHEPEYREYSALNQTTSVRTMVIRGNQLAVAGRTDLAFISGQKWRSGVKHDAADILELTGSGGTLMNKLGHAVNLPSEATFPFMKSSDLMKGESVPKRRLVMPPSGMHGYSDAAKVPVAALNDYLEQHAAVFARRKSAVYSEKDRFSVFGVGAYSFKPWKIAISAFSKAPVFQVIGPNEGKPVLFDDTVYFLAFDTQVDAQAAFELLTSEHRIAALAERMFVDDMRPAKARILNSLFCIG